MFHKILPVLLLAVVLLTAVYLSPLKYPVLKSNTLFVQVAYRLGISEDNTYSCCEEEVVAYSKGVFDENADTAIFNGKEIDYPKTSLASIIHQTLDGEESTVLGTFNTAGEEKWIEVSLDQQMLRAWEGNKIVMEFPISSGKWYATPKGTYNIWYKTRAQKMEGGSKEWGTYYYLPNVPHNMFFHKGYAIHGAYWHNNFGTPMSHGCVNAPLDQVDDLFYWSGPVLPERTGHVKASKDNPGTKVFVH